MSSVDPSELLEHTSWLRQLARSLVTEGADDLVQDTWVAALRRPPRGDRGVRPWLRTVVTNAARLRWRSDSNRAAREQVAADLGEREVPSPEQLLERHELQQVLARLVSELEEPFRSTILLRFAEGLAPTEISRRLGVPAGTVRWRLKEALDRLRTQLDALHRGDRRAWVVAFAPVAASQPSPAIPLIPLVVAIAAVSACVAVVIGVVSSGLQSTRPTTPTDRSSPRAHVSGVHASTPTSAHEALAWLAQEGVPARELSGRVLMRGAPVPGSTVRLLADPLSPRTVQTDASGRFDFGPQAPREYTLGASLPGKLAAIRRVDLRDPGAPRDVELVLEDCAASLYGKVIDASGTPIEGAQLFREGVIGVETDRAGNYELCTLPTAALFAEIRIVVRADGFGTLAVPLAPPGRMHHDFVLAPEATVSGRIVDSKGEPIANAQISIDLTGHEASVPPERGLALATISTSDGTFRIAGLAAGEYTIAATSARSVSRAVPIKLEAAENRSLELRAAETGVVRGRVLSRGVPVAGVTVAVDREVAVSQADGSFVLSRVPVGDIELTTSPYKRTSGTVHVTEGDHNVVDVIVEPMGILRGTVRRHGVPVPFARVGIYGPTPAGVTTDANGRYEARGLEPGQYGFYCDDRRRSAMYAEDRAVDLGPAETREHDIELAWGGSISGHVVDAQGNAVPGAAVSFRTASDCLTDARGAFTCAGLAGGSYTPSVRPASETAHAFRFVEQPRTIELRDGDARVEGVRLVVDANLQQISGNVADRDGAPVPDIAVRAFAINRAQRGNLQRDLAAVTDEDGRFRLSGLSPGDYYIEVESRGLATRRTVPAGTTNVSLVLARPPCEGAQAREIPNALIRPSAPVIWERQVELVGWVLPSAITVGAPMEMTLVYRTLKPLDRDWRIFAHFDSRATRVNGDHEPAIGWCPTSQWGAGDVIADRVSVQFEQSGRYTLTVGFFAGVAPQWENMPLSAVPTTMKSETQGGVRLAEIAVE